MKELLFGSPEKAKLKKEYLDNISKSIPVNEIIIKVF